MAVKVGNQTWQLMRPPVILETATVAGPLEGEGPLHADYDSIYADPVAGESSFEAAEREMMLNACFTALQKAGLAPSNIDVFLAGDLLNQTITSGFSAQELKIPYLGIYGACSSSAESLIIAAALVEAGFARLVLAAVSSHNSSAERQYRYPTEYGVHRKPTAQWTVTGAGAALVAAPDVAGRLDAAGRPGTGGRPDAAGRARTEASGASGAASTGTPGGSGTLPQITHVTIGKVNDFGIKDPLNMGAAMAPGAVDTLINHFADTGRGPDYYDLIATGDLGSFGHELVVRLAAERGGFTLSDNYQDCGVLIYDFDKQDVHAGGSGCACSALVTFGHLYHRMQRGELKRVLLCATGSLHSPTSVQQGNNIPVIAHAVSLEMTSQR